MTSRSFRRLFPQLNMQSIPEDEFYRQASQSQLLTGPDEQELASFRPDIKDPLELVEATPELAGMLGSSLEFVDTRWDSMEASPPPTPSPPSQPQRVTQLCPPQRQRVTEDGAKVDNVSQNRSAESGQLQGFKNMGYSTAEGKTETKKDTRLWDPQKLGCKNTGAPVPTKPNVTMNANMWEPQTRQSKNIGIVNSANTDPRLDSSVWEQQSRNTWTSHAADSNSKTDFSTYEQQQHRKDIGIANPANPDLCMWQQQQQGNKSIRHAPVKPDAAAGAPGCEPQRPQGRSAGNSDTKSDAALSGQERIQNKTTANPANSNGAGDANVWKQPNQGCETDGVSDSTTPSVSVDGTVCEPQQRLRSKTSPAKLTVDPKTWERQGTKRIGCTSTAPKREANAGDNQGPGGKNVKMDAAAWQRNLGNVRVHIRDLGLKVGGVDIRREVNKEQGKGARVKTKS